MQEDFTNPNHQTENEGEPAAQGGHIQKTDADKSLKWFNDIPQPKKEISKQENKRKFILTVP